ncbi:puromycin-sensitive aminopeptidase-like protein [Bactrocera neohumeralis]|uniref:puromycin-sensitive aminopeptidase-like protein n=1 Tax=Bactrocera neohumeralis TaxID=98809 RepID=UPI0021659E29|nr:puromycin-sensitive aminopeptidase-like protein [Bactrocera neohumeralis]
MSTYLVAWVIGELESIQKTVRLPYSPDRETVVSLYAAPGQASKGQFSLDLAVRVLPLYEKFFECGYIGDKMDLVAIPDFAAGAMENVACVTFRESAILIDESTTTMEKKYVALVVAHELAHMWFGDAVTMVWWNALFLNEAFATYMEYYAVDKLIPEWNVFTEMLQREGGALCSLTRWTALTLSRSMFATHRRSMTSSTPSVTPKAPVSSV